MRKNKIISLILAIVLCFTATILVVTADTKNASISISADKTTITAGETATISVNVTTDFPVATMSIPVFYDKTMVTVSEATATLTDYAVKSTTTDVESVNSEKVYADTNIDSDKYGFVLVTYIASAGSDVSAAIDGTVLTFKVTANTDVEGDALFNCVAESAKTADNVDGMLYFGSPTSGNTINSVPENVENIDFTSASETVVVTNGSTEPNTLVLNENAPFEAIIDLNNNIGGEYTGTVYGFDTLGYNDDWVVDGSIAEFLSTAYGDDYLEVIVPDIGVETTGTVINVLDENGDVVESYMYIYFGDMDMDGEVGGSDGTLAEDYGMYYEGIDSLATFMAGDLDGDGMPSGSDAIYMIDWGMYYEGLPLQSDVGVMAVDIFYEIF